MVSWFHDRENQMKDLHKELKRIFNKNPQILENRSRLRGVLGDFMQQDLYINLLMNAYDINIYEELRKVKEIDELFINRLNGQMCKKYGVNEEYAKWSIITWSLACSKEIPSEAKAYLTISTGEKDSQRRSPVSNPSSPSTEKHEDLEGKSLWDMATAAFSRLSGNSTEGKIQSLEQRRKELINRVNAKKEKMLSDKNRICNEIDDICSVIKNKKKTIDTLEKDLSRLKDKQKTLENEIYELKAEL